MKTFFTQHKINFLNFIIAILALLISIPAAINQINQYFQDQERNTKTKVVYFSPPDIDIKKANTADKCWGSSASSRTDAYRCMGKNMLQDPCFWVEKYVTTSVSYFYCPSSWRIMKTDNIFAVDEKNVDRPDWNIEKEKETLNKLPWLMVLEGDVVCRLHTGAVDIAYGNKGNIYGCDSTKYSSVTSGILEEGRQFFECKLANEALFKKCFAKLAVF